MILLEHASSDKLFFHQNGQNDTFHFHNNIVDLLRQFQEILCKKIGGGVTSFGGITGSHLSEYYLFLKSEYGKEDNHQRGYRSTHKSH